MAEMSRQERAKKLREERARKQREERERRRAEQQAKQEAANKEMQAESARAEERPNDWAGDLGGLIKSAGKNTLSAADAVSDVLIDKDAWKAIAPGGEKATFSDFANVALDASLLIPGAGLAGGAARIGARQLAKNAGREAAEAGARKLSPMAERVAARDAAAGRAVPGARRAGPTQTGPKTLNDAKTKLTQGLERVGTRAERTGKGRKYGLGQTKGRTALTGAVTGGANLLGRAYDEGVFGGGGKASTAPGGGAPAGAGADAGAVYMIGGAPYPLAFGTGGEMSVPPSTQRALAGYYAQGGSPDGAQVVYLSGN